MSILEAAAALLGVVNVALIIRRNVWNYPFGLTMVAAYTVVFAEARLYSDALLQVFFFAIQIYGWWAWLRGRGRDGLIVVERLQAGGRLAALAACAGISAGLGWAMAAHTDAAVPYWDAAIAGTSIVAQLLMSRRKIESWLLWIAVDMAAVALFWSRGLGVTAALYLLFLGMAVAGLAAWKRASERREALP